MTILGVDLAAGTIVLSSNADSRLAGAYSFWFANEAGHARVGEIITSDDDTVTREVLGVDFGDLTAARRGRMSGWFHLSPRDLGYPYRDVTIDTPLGPAPAWLIPAAEDSARRWVINVHGRGVRRSETLRAVEPFRDAGYSSLLVSYRNDGDAPRSDDYRYALGDREWRDIEPAMQYALDHGAEELVLMGWSMGGATVLQALTRSPLGTKVIGIVLESPVVDWITTLDFQAAIRGLPAIVRWGVLQLYGRPWGKLFTGLAEPLDLDRLDFVRRARELDPADPHPAQRRRRVRAVHSIPSPRGRTARHRDLRGVRRRPAHQAVELRPDRWVGAIRDWLEGLGPR